MMLRRSTPHPRPGRENNRPGPTVRKTMENLHAAHNGKVHFDDVKADTTYIEGEEEIRTLREDLPPPVDPESMLQEWLGLSPGGYLLHILVKIIHIFSDITCLIAWSFVFLVGVWLIVNIQAAIQKVLGSENGDYDAFPWKGFRRGLVKEMQVFGAFVLVAEMIPDRFIGVWAAFFLIVFFKWF